MVAKINLTTALIMHELEDDLNRLASSTLCEKDSE